MSQQSYIMVNIINYQGYKIHNMYYIYEVVNLINKNTYIGQHKYLKLPDKYLGSGILLSRAVRKYGVSSFKKNIILSGIETQSEINDWETYFIFRNKCIGRAQYNIADGGLGGSRKWTAEEKKQASLRQKGKPVTDACRKAAILARKGHPISSEHLNAIIAANKGREVSQETRAKLSSIFKNRKFNEGTRKRMSESAKKRSHDSYHKSIMCVETGKVYLSVNDAARDINVSASCISWALHNGTVSAKCHWKFIKELK